MKGTGRETRKVTLGFIPLVDCAPLAVAQELGFFARQGIDVALSREASWATIRDKVAVGALDGGHMLGAMPLASTLGLSGLSQPLVTALGLSLRGNAITLSRALADRLPADAENGAAGMARALGALLRTPARPVARPTLAVTFPFSSHSYMLREWLHLGGVDPDRDVRIVVVAPPRMSDQLAAGAIDGFCVGEPWNVQAMALGCGRVVATSAELWGDHPEKVLAVAEEWALAHSDLHQSLLRALIGACRWCDAPENRDRLTAILSDPAYVGLDAEIIADSLSGPLSGAPLFFRSAATYPAHRHAVWWLTQMRRWGQLDGPLDVEAIARRVYRPDLYRTAAGDLGLAAPEPEIAVDAGPPMTASGAASARPPGPSSAPVPLPA